MKKQGLLFNLELNQGPPELIEALRLMEEALEMQKAELAAPGLTIADCAAMKRAGEKAASFARSYALNAERRLGQILLGRPGCE